MIRPALLILAVAAALRLMHLDTRPMHADEAILADKFGELLESGRFPYDPTEFHGPVLAYVAIIPARIAGRASYSRLSESTLRVVPAVAGIILALSPLLLVPAIGSRAALSAAALLAVSPAAVYYSRFFIPETLLALWTAALLALLSRAMDRPLLWAAAGAIAGLMLATKETAVLSFAALALSVLLSGCVRRPSLRVLGTLTASLVLSVSLLLAPPWRWTELMPAIAAYLGRGAGGGFHSNPWYYYFSLMGWELPLAALGVVLAWRFNNPYGRLLVCYTLLLAAIYSAIPYKTPWCVLSILYGFCILAGIAIDAMARRWQFAVSAVAMIGCAFFAWQAWTKSTERSVDPRNPFAYAHTGPGVFVIRDRLREVARKVPHGNGTAIAVYSRQNLWPLPWYFREYPNVRWWRNVDLQGPAAPVVLLTPEMEDDVTRKIYEGPPAGQRELYMTMFDVELRPHVPVRGYVSNSLWEQLGR